jgi:phospholipase C
MADFGVYFEVTNNLSAPLSYLKSDLVDATYDGPSTIPADGVPHVVHLADPYGFRGAEGTVYFTAVVDGALRQYAWYGTCPVWSPDNGANGPGVLRFNGGGHPLTVTIAVDASTPGWTPVSQLIEHVFLLMLENRSFDHMLGFSNLTGTDAATGQPTTIDGLTGSEQNPYGGKEYSVSTPADYVMPKDPGHEFTDVVTQLAGAGAHYPWGGPYPPIDGLGFVADYAAMGGASAPGEIMKCYNPDQLPVLVALASEFALCDNWHASMPGPTWPNRFFSLAASSAGLDHSPSLAQILAWAVTGVTFLHGSLFDAMTRAKGTAGWRIYAGDHVPMSAFINGVHYLDIQDFDKRFAADLGSGDYPWTFTLIEPNYGDVIGNTYVGGTSEHPMDDVTHGEALIKSTYEAIRNSLVWNSSLLIVTWDEHGGFYDHSAPPIATAPGDTAPGSTFNEFGFDFKLFGVRVPSVVVSPLIPRNQIDHRLYDHSSIPATLEALFRFPALTGRDAAASNVTSLITLSSPREDCPTTLPNPAVSGAPDMRTLAFVAGQERAVEDTRTADAGNLPGFLGVALRQDLAIDPEHREETLQRFARIETREDARRYLDSVWAKLGPQLGSPQPARSDREKGTGP